MVDLLLARNHCYWGVVAMTVICVWCRRHQWSHAHPMIGVWCGKCGLFKDKVKSLKENSGYRGVLCTRRVINPSSVNQVVEMCVQKKVNLGPEVLFEPLFSFLRSLPGNAHLSDDELSARCLFWVYLYVMEKNPQGMSRRTLAMHLFVAGKDHAQIMVEFEESYRHFRRSGLLPFGGVLRSEDFWH